MDENALNEKNGDNCHKQDQIKLWIEFSFGIVTITIAFILIIITFFQNSHLNQAAASKIFLDVVMVTVAFIFFRQATKTRKNVIDHLERLHHDKQMSESKKNVDSIGDEKLKNAVKAQIALHMSGLQPNPIDLNTFLSLKDDKDVAKPSS